MRFSRGDGRTRGIAGRSRLRRFVTLLLLLPQLALASAVHHHAAEPGKSSLENDAVSPRLVHEIACAAPNALHWHRDRTVEVEACLACLLRHLAGVGVAAPRTAGLRPVRPFVPEFSRASLERPGAEVSSRGPPVLS